MNIFTVKQVPIFDKNKITRGSFITYCILEVGDEGDYREEGYYRNGVISYVDHNYITVINEDGNKKCIEAKSVEGTPGYVYGPNGIRIKGITRYAFIEE
ncbi:hypothetical protein P59_150 [Bacillus phage P59]|nr:hypothetical protein P59_150 [Bacillus phage P59]